MPTWVSQRLGILTYKMGMVATTLRVVKIVQMLYVGLSERCCQGAHLVTKQEALASYYSGTECEDREISIGQAFATIEGRFVNRLEADEPARACRC